MEGPSAVFLEPTLAMLLLVAMPLAGGAVVHPHGASAFVMGAWAGTFWWRRLMIICGRWVAHDWSIAAPIGASADPDRPHAVDVLSDRY